MDGQTSVEETVQNLDFSEDGILCIRVTFSGKNVTSCKPWLRVGFRRPGVGWDYSVNAQSSFTQIPIPETGRSYFLTQPVQGGTEIHIVASMTGTSEATMTINYTFYAAGIE